MNEELTATGASANLSLIADRSSLGRRGALAAIRLYQRWLSPAMGAACRFEPTCSRYTYEAIERFGVARGTWLGVRRLLRCTPLHKGGVDPVPER